MTLRNSLVAKIWAAIERSPFTAADFNVILGGKKENLLFIEFRHHTAFNLAVSEDQEGNVFIRVAPGEHKKEEFGRLISLATIPDHVIAWTKNVRDELRSVTPVYAELDELRDTIERHVAEHVENPESPFSVEEVNDLREKLDQLLARFQEMKESSEMTEQELKRLSQELANIKSNLATYPRGVWYKTAANKLWSTVNKIAASKESRQVIAQAAKKLLGLDASVL